MSTRKRRAGSIARELVKKAREAMLTAVQVYNNPQIEFKSELFIVTTIIAWTYLLHGFYRRRHVEYRQFQTDVKRRHFLRTKYGAIRHWGLEECLDAQACPLDEVVKKNLRFLIGLRHEIEHQMTTRIDDQVSAKFQAAALNFNAAIKKLFGTKYSLDAEQAFSIQFSGITESSAKELMIESDLPQHIRSFVVEFEDGLTQQEFDDPRFSYRVAFVRKISNSRTAADKVITFVSPETDTAAAINKVFLKETERMKYLPKTIVKQMKAEGFFGFDTGEHTRLWQRRDAKNPKFQFGTMVEGNWYWYDSWLAEVRKYCQEHFHKISREQVQDRLSVL